MPASDNTLDRLRVRWLRGLQDSGWMSIQPVHTLAQRYPFAQQVMSDLKLLMRCAVVDDVLVLPGMAQSYVDAEDDPEIVQSPKPAQTEMWFQCTLRPDDSDPLRAALVDLRLLNLGQAATVVALRLTYDVLGDGNRLRLYSVWLDDRGSDALIHAARTPFRQDWGVSWNFESRFFRPYPEEEPRFWLRVGFRTDAGLLPTIFERNPTRGPDEPIEHNPGGPEYLRVEAILRSVNESVRVFLSDIVDRPADRLPYGYRAVDRVIIWDTLATLFIEDELCDLAFRLGINCDNLRGSTHSSKARALVEHCERRDMLLRLARQILRERPGAEVWAI